VRLFLIGATGRLGGHVLAEALARGHAVTALVRDPARLAIAHPHLRVVAGDVRDAADMAAALGGHDAVVSALGTRRGQASPDVLSEGMAAIASAMAAQGLRRVVAVASAGILQADAVSLRRDRPGYPEAFRRSSAAHLAAYEILRASGLDWTIMAPPELVEGPRDQAIVVQEDYLPDGLRRVAMPALARLMVDELERPRHVRRRVGMIDAPGG
jgi:putative NADH-flavin reductase